MTNVLTEAELKKKKKAEAEKRKSAQLAEAVAKRLAEVKNAKGDATEKKDSVASSEPQDDKESEDALKDNEEVGVFS